ncbi:MAG: hypothetical protein CW345_00965 [Firmicutes bacterium]|nr:hypothetical protein [Bacillota bacterium]MBO2520368.1 hypothetical protein [Bacillota bacterium]
MGLRWLKLRVREYFRSRAVIYALVAALLAAGAGAGAVGAGLLDGTDRAELAEFVDEYVRQAGDGGLSAAPADPRDFWTELARSALLPWVLGLSVIGAPLALVLVFLRGFAVGFTVRFLVEEFSVHGAILSLVSVAPHSALILFGVALAAGAGLAFAAGAVRILTGRAVTEPVYRHLAAAILLCAVASGSVAAGAWLQARVAPVLTGMVFRWLPM